MLLHEEIKVTPAIINWWSNLVSHINKSISEGRKVVIIALSRKMPRLLECIMNEDDSFKAEFSRLLDSCIYTTEHAIPFVIKKNEVQDVYVLDDIIDSGRTVQSVVDEINDITDTHPFVFPLYKRNSCNINNAKIYGGENLSSELIQQRSSDISNIIRAINLPVDLEYPILKASAPASFDYKKSIMNWVDSLRAIRYEVEKGNETIILEEETKKSYNNDFAKMRFFIGANSLKVVPFAPNIFSESALIQDKLFFNEHYKELYKSVLSRLSVDEDYWMNWNNNPANIPEKRRLTRIFRTLTVWANYLFSLSAFIRCKANIESAGTLKFEVDYSDLSLILGNELAKEIEPRLNQLILSNEVSPSKRELLKIPACMINPGLLGSYKIQKYRVVFNERTVEGALNRIFGLLRYISSRSSGTEGFVTPQETYESIFEALSMRFDLSEIVGDVYKWVDQKVDEGVIIPRYERVAGANGFHYWRRFFSVRTNG